MPTGRKRGCASPIEPDHLFHFLLSSRHFGAPFPARDYRLLRRMPDDGKCGEMRVSRGDGLGSLSGGFAPRPAVPERFTSDIVFSFRTPDGGLCGDWRILSQLRVLLLGRGKGVSASGMIICLDKNLGVRDQAVQVTGGSLVAPVILGDAISSPLPRSRRGSRR